MTKIYSNDDYLSLVKYFYEVMLAISLCLFGVAISSWLQVDGFGWENISGLVPFTVSSSCLVLVFGSLYLKKKRPVAKKHSEEK